MSSRPVTISDFALWMGVEREIVSSLGARSLPDIWMDSRKITPGDLFLALPGEERDGHDYVVTALEQGACAAIVSSLEKIPGAFRDRVLLVHNPLEAVSAAARAYRRYLDIPCIGITGSNGKTTTARFLRTILEQNYRVGGTEGNWNNHIGLPLSILRLTGHEDLAVFELGANHGGEIFDLAEILEPDMGIITNIGYAHVGCFGGIEKTAAAKFELAEVLGLHQGVLYVNGDDSHSMEQMRHSAYAGLTMCTFGTSEAASLRAENVYCTSEGTYGFTYHGEDFHIPLPGRHFVYAMLPALALAESMGVDSDMVRSVLATLRPAPLRGEVRNTGQYTLVLDCYNANPSSMNAAFQMMHDMPAPSGRLVSISGDMAELGAYSDSLHRNCGAAAAEYGMEVIIHIGEFGAALCEGAMMAGMDQEVCHCFASKDAFITAAPQLLAPGDRILLKGSRASELETLIPFLTGEV
ncbi:UDP-N-acetylmuramoyl-tripeptide--D-alanyl-D-alanine ligase [Chitinivibrio alkaliphilus]|uniref:UDP-N-acetylmuramoyl-tripeptide--D-alanyl-D-alanine ligase n=1 Tax=Chitinivibrio alkaliphilus ACht1 TaxID=1313304 RepID=U7D9U6_9BACT|nr:UDP-N-acetylmuramoyl-tripeptide--D-alanyl-D-alanine ligase [Chitinivibrio alkaliphilus]ERP31200.1 UDP-N-acetylmuramoyl-tripeptide--D-alanyl-D-alanine ligase [Chitinivibrio alkaliphilus ACht1]